MSHPNQHITGREAFVEYLNGKADENTRTAIDRNTSKLYSDGIEGLKMEPNVSFLNTKLVAIEQQIEKSANIQNRSTSNIPWVPIIGASVVAAIVAVLIWFLSTRTTDNSLVQPNNNQTVQEPANDNAKPLMNDAEVLTDEEEVIDSNVVDSAVAAQNDTVTSEIETETETASNPAEEEKPPVVTLTGTVTLESAMALYQNDEHAKAVAAFDQVIAKNPNEKKAYYYAGLSSMRLGKNAQSMGYFDAIINKGPSYYYNGSRYCKGLLYTYDKENAKAIELFRAVAASTSSYAADAKKRLQAMGVQ